MSKGKLIVISGPSGVGKGEIVKGVLSRKHNVSLSVSCTTRSPRENEIEGVSYFFISKELFEKMIAEGGFLEYSKHFDNYYGTPAAFVEEKLSCGNDVILEIDVDGALNVKKAKPDAVLVLIVPPDMQTLYERLKGRDTEDEDEIKKRMERADYELSKGQQYAYVIVNDKLCDAVDKVLDIMEKEN
ncbi:MAG: guanylate kinase [Clostridia bacterium]|nr:guanylate kinase [Clostridia bacterium]